MGKMINENRMLKLLPSFFSNPDAVITELAQNASRAKATKMGFQFKGDTLTVTDNGNGADMASSLLILAESGWDTETVEEQQSAGFGLYVVLSLSKAVTFASKFGTLTIDCPRFMEDMLYREAVLSQVDRSKKYKGFKITAELNENASRQLTRNVVLLKDKLGYFPLDITVNGEVIEKKRTESLCEHWLIEARYDGNEVLIDPYAVFGIDEANRAYSCVWYGIPIRGHSSPGAVINVTKGTPVTPVLPFRTGLKSDQRLQEFHAFVRTQAVNFCSEIVNSETSDLSAVKKAVFALQHTATQEELDKLNRWLVTKEEPYSREDAYENPRCEAIVVKGKSVVSENLRVFVKNDDGTFDRKKDEDIVLPAGSIFSVYEEKMRPSWLKIRKKTVNVFISPLKECQGSLLWVHAEIKCAGKQIGCVAAIDDSCDGEVYYATDKAKDVFGEVENTIFNKRFYRDDGGDYDGQQWEFEQQMKRDIQKVDNEYNLNAVLKSLGDHINVDLHKIRAINISKGSLKILMAGSKTVVLPLAA